MGWTCDRLPVSKVETPKRHTGHASTIAIADREFLFRTGLQTILSQDTPLTILPPVSTIAELRVAVSCHRPSLILMSPAFPDGDGIAACRTLRARHPSLRILFFAHASAAELVRRAVDAGAQGFLLKTISRAALKEAVYRSLSGHPTLDPSLNTAFPPSTGPRPNGPHRMLSPRQRQILPLLSEGLTNREIGTHLRLSEKTVKNYLADLFDRLQMTRRAQVAAWYTGRTPTALHDRHGN